MASTNDDADNDADDNDEVVTMAANERGYERQHRGRYQQIDRARASSVIGLVVHN